MSDLNIYQRINEVKKVVTYVQKDKQVSAPGQNYKAVTHDQVVSVARAAMVAQGIVCYPEQISSEILIQRDVEKNIKMHLYSGDYNIVFVNIDKPEDRIIVPINAQAADNGDKAPGKAVTYATKAAILKVLQLETGEDDESRAEARNTITNEQISTIESMLKDNEKIKRKLLGAYGISSVSELKSSKFDECKTRITKALEAANGNN